MNFRGILSKSSLRSSSSGKSITHQDEVTKLQSEIESLKLTVDSLKVSVESRDAAIGTLAREKEKIYVELKSTQRTNRNLHQQLVDERDIHSKEKEFLINEIKRLSKRNEHELNSQKKESSYEDQPKKIMDELKAKDEVIYNIGAKYMKIKSSKITLQKKLEKIQLQNKKTCENIIFLLQDNRKTLDDLLKRLLKSSTVSPNSKKYLNLLQINANLHYENTQLKIYLSTKNSNVREYQDCDFSHEPCVNTCSIHTQSKVGTKSEVKIRDQSDGIPESRHRTVHSKFKRINYDCPELNFKFLHKTFSPNFRSRFYRSLSDTCILRNEFSQFINIGN